MGMDQAFLDKQKKQRLEYTSIPAVRTVYRPCKISASSRELLATWFSFLNPGGFCVCWR